ncbi:MAG: DUF523 and DUF1722 domain-containing protein [bacterium]|nr:DUF523 and DUF1722 domain-containing protein [bacterium]
MDEKLKLGISSCLLGEKVRYNGGHKLDFFLVDVLGRYVNYVPVCPEVEIGLGTPREPVRLTVPGESTRLVTQTSGIDHTDRMLQWSGKQLERLDREGLCGYVFKSKSPSCGLARVKLYRNNKVIPGRGGGIFAHAFTRRFPLLPVEEEGRLRDIELRENFIVRVFTVHRWRKGVKEDPTVARLMDFHTRNKLIYMAHHPQLAGELGRLTAKAAKIPMEELLHSYETLMMKCLEYKATGRKNANVLYHIMGYFKKHLEPDEKQELIETIENYRLTYLPLVAPLTLLKHYVRKYRVSCLEDQYYLDPHPMELKLRNHA